MDMRIYEFLLRLYPKDHQELFGAEMAEVLREASEGQRAIGRRAYLRFTVWEIAGLLAGAAALWAAKFAGDSHREPEAEAAPAPPNDIVKTEQLIQRNLHCMTQAIATHQFEKARFYSKADIILRARLQKLHDRYGISE